jgi:DNA-binding NtrC family response regulator
MAQRFARILIVDDDADVCAITCAMLEEMGHRVSAANDAAAARSILEAESIDLLVTDKIAKALGQPTGSADRG